LRLMLGSDAKLIAKQLERGKETKQRSLL
jgi:hypothetical protein